MKSIVDIKFTLNHSEDQKYVLKSVKHMFGLVSVLLRSLLVSGDDLLELVHIGSSEIGHLGLVLHEDEGRHSGDLVLRSNILAIININLQLLSSNSNFKDTT